MRSYDGMISMGQVQCYRKCRAAHCLRMLVKTMRERRGTGSVTRSWRFDFDKDGDGQVNKEDFERSCHILHCAADFGVIWEGIHPGGGDEPVELWDLAPEEAQDLEALGALFLNASRFDLRKVWSMIDPYGSGQAGFDQFRRTAKTLGFPGSDFDLQRLYKGLDGTGYGVIFPEALDVMWVICFNRQHSSMRRRSQVSGILDGPLDMLDFDELLVKTGLDRPGSARTTDREISECLERIGYYGAVVKVALPVVRHLLKKRGEVIHRRAVKGERPEWVDVTASDHPKRAKPFPFKYLYDMHLPERAPLPRNNLFGSGMQFGSPEEQVTIKLPP